MPRNSCRADYTGSRPIATADKAQQATAPATIPNGNTIESTPLPKIIHIFTAVHIVKM